MNNNNNIIDDLLAPPIQPVQDNFVLFNEDGSVNNPVPQAPQEQSIPAVRVKQQQPQDFQQPVPMQAPVQQPVQQVPSSTADNLVKLINKESYTDAEWQEREQIYVEECRKIHIDPTTLTPSEIAIAAGRIDNLLTPLRIDNIYAQRQTTRLDNQLKIKKELYYNLIKQQAGQLKITVDETKSGITDRIYNEVFEEGMNLFDLMNKYMYRSIMTKGMIDTLQDKKDLLITYSAILKIEHTTNNFTPSVPTQNQLDRMG